MVFQIIGFRIHHYIGYEVRKIDGEFQYIDKQLHKHFISVLYEGKKYEIELRQEFGECSSGWCVATYGIMIVREVKKFNYTWKLLPEFDGIVYQELPLENIYKFNCPYFRVTYDGGDRYYPEGYYHVHQIYFYSIPRHKEKRPIWLLTGNKQFLLDFTRKKSEKIITSENVFYVKNDIEFIHNLKKNIIGNNEFIYVSFDLYYEVKNTEITWILYGASGLGKSYLTDHLKSVYETDSAPTLPQKITKSIIVIGNKYYYTIDQVILHLNSDTTIVTVYFSEDKYNPQLENYEQKKLLISEIKNEVAYRPKLCVFHDILDTWCSKYKYKRKNSNESLVNYTN
jgi:hypothetical protein